MEFAGPYPFAGPYAFAAVVQDNPQTPTGPQPAPHAAQRLPNGLAVAAAAVRVASR
jgi:hypothetical protein